VSIDIKSSKLPNIINDRKILEFLLSHNGREVLRKDGIAGLADININNNLDIISPTTVKSNTTVSRAAELLMDIHNPYLILEEEEAPWDIVMKTLKSDHIIGSFFIVCIIGRSNASKNNSMQPRQAENHNNSGRLLIQIKHKIAILLCNFCFYTPFTTRF
jgi:hypothetical protein